MRMFQEDDTVEAIYFSYGPVRAVFLKECSDFELLVTDKSLCRRCYRAVTLEVMYFCYDLVRQSSCQSFFNIYY